MGVKFFWIGVCELFQVIVKCFSPKSLDVLIWSGTLWYFPKLGAFCRAARNNVLCVKLRCTIQKYSMYGTNYSMKWSWLCLMAASFWLHSIQHGAAQYSHSSSSSEKPHKRLFLTIGGVHKNATFYYLHFFIQYTFRYIIRLNHKAVGIGCKKTLHK